MKSFSISLFVYWMQSIGVNDEYIKKINTIIYRFIWNPQAKPGKKLIEKVKRETIDKRYEHWGLINMIDIKKKSRFLPFEIGR